LDDTRDGATERIAGLARKAHLVSKGDAPLPSGAMSQRLAHLASLGLLGAAVFTACSSSAPPAEPAGQEDAGSFDASRPECTAGESAPCYCPNGGFGTTVCSETGTGFGECMGCVDASSPPGDAGGGGADSGTPHDAGEIHDASDGSAPPAPPAAFALVHAAPGVPPVRLCFGSAAAGQAASVLAIPPIPDEPSSAPAVPAIGAYPAVAKGTPGIYPGSVATLPFQNDLSDQALELYAVLASSVSGDVASDGGLGTGPDGGPEESCTALVGSSGLGTGDTPPGRLVAGTDFFALPVVAAGTFGATGAYLLSLTGCLSGAGLGAETCGASEAASPAIGVATLDTTSVATASFGAQFAHRSSALEGTAFGGHAAASSGVEPVLVSSSGTVTPLFSSAAAVLFSGTGIGPSPAAAAAFDPTAQGAAFGVVLLPPDGGSPSMQAYPAGDLVAMPLATIQSLSSWTASTASGATAFASGYAYTFVLVGDPSAPAASDPSYDGRGIHFVAFPNVFTAKTN
jgi:hypothetical protein